MARDLAKKLGITPIPPDNDLGFADQAKAVARLQSKSGDDFYRDYIKHEIAFHQSVINSLNQVLLPAIKNNEIKQLVINVLPGLKHHLEQTKSTAKKLGLN